MPHSQVTTTEKKKFLLKLALISFLALLLIFYTLNLKNVFYLNTESAKKNEDFDWGKIKDDFDATFSQVNKDFKSAKQKQVAQAATPVLDKLVDEFNLKNQGTQTPTVMGLPSSATITVDNISASSSLELLEAKINANKKK